MNTQETKNVLLKSHIHNSIFLYTKGSFKNYPWEHLRTINPFTSDLLKYIAINKRERE